MKKLLILIALFPLSVIAQQKPDTSKRPLVYWKELIQLQNINNELSRRIHKLDIPALRRDSLDMLSFEISQFPALIYQRSRDTSKVKGGKKP